MQAKLLCYNLPDDKADYISALCYDMDIGMRTVEKNELLKPLSELCGFDTQTEKVYSGEGFKEEMLVLCFFTHELLNSFLYSFRQRGIKPVALKAVLTEHNFEWSSLKLYEDIKQEHEYFIQNKKDNM